MSTCSLTHTRKFIRNQSCLSVVIITLNMHFFFVVIVANLRCNIDNIFSMEEFWFISRMPHHFFLLLNECKIVPMDWAYLCNHSAHNKASDDCLHFEWRCLHTEFTSATANPLTMIRLLRKSDCCFFSISRQIPNWFRSIGELNANDFFIFTNSHDSMRFTGAHCFNSINARQWRMSLGKATHSNYLNQSNKRWRGQRMRITIPNILASCFFLCLQRSHVVSIWKFSVWLEMQS